MGRAGKGNQPVIDSPDERRTKQRQDASAPGLPPSDMEAERGVLSSLMLAPMMMDELTDRLSPDDFYSDAHRNIYIAIANIHAAGRRCDAVLLHDRLKRANQLEAVGGLAYLVELADMAGHAANVFWYADIVRECAMRRRMIYVCTETLRAAYDDTAKAKEVAKIAEAKIADIAAARDADSLHRIADVAKARLHKAKNANKPARGIRTGIHMLDEIFKGYEAGHLNIVAARTSVGKTALATSHVSHWLVNTDLVGYFCSLEMTEEEVTERVLINIASVDAFRFREHYCNDAELGRIKEAVELIQGNSHRLFIDHAPNRTVREIVSMARRCKRVGDRLDYVIVDYLQLIDGENAFAKRHEQVSAITRQLKIAAKELGVPIIALAQLNRDADGTRPKLSQLRESGSIEQDADKVIFIDRPTEDPDGNGADAIATLIVAKNRHGRVGDCKAAFYGGYQRFQGMAIDANF